MTAMPPESDNDRATREASDWLARLRAPGGEDEADAFERWYVAEPANAGAYDRVLDSWQQMHLVGKTPAGEARTRFFNVGPQPFSRRLAVGVAALMLFAVMGFGAVHFGAGQPLIPAAYASGIGQIRTIRLSDGSVVTLDTDSALKVSFDKRERRLTLVRGRARFVVANVGGTPFSVAAGNCVIIATGTIFDVDVAGSTPSVSLIQGSVRVVRGLTAVNNPGRSLRPGQTVALSDNGAASSTDMKSIADTRWVSGMVSFENAPLADVVFRANRYGRAKIVLADDTTQRLRFTGTFRPTDTQTLVRMLAMSFKLRVQREGSGDFILSHNGS